MKNIDKLKDKNIKDAKLKKEIKEKAEIVKKKKHVLK